MMIIITSKIFKKIDDNNYIKKYLKRSVRSVGIPRSKIFKENTTKLSSLNV